MQDIRPARGAKASGGRFLSLPSTGVGWWAGGFFLAWIVWLVVRSRLLSPMGIVRDHLNKLPAVLDVTLLLALAAAVIALVALIFYHERSWVAWLALLPGALVLLVLLTFGLGGG